MHSQQQQQQQQRGFSVDLVVCLLVVCGAALRVVDAGPGATAAAAASRLFFKDGGSAAEGQVAVVRAVEGQNVVLECEAGGSPSPTVHWIRNGQRLRQGHSERWDDDEPQFEMLSGITVGSSSLKLSLTRSRLFVDCLTPSTAGEYVCIAETPARRISKQFFIEIDDSESNEAQAISCMKQNVEGAARVYMWTSHRIELEGADVQLFCRADGVPKPTVTWYDRDDNVITDDSPQYRIMDSGDLLVRKVNWMSNMGLYRCVAGNSLDTDTVHVFLYPTKAK